MKKVFLSATLALAMLVGMAQEAPKTKPVAKTEKKADAKPVVKSEKKAVKSAKLPAAKPVGAEKK